MRNINPQREYQIVSLRNNPETPNTMDVIANVLGVMDSYGGVIAPTSIKSGIIDVFLREGSILNAHDDSQVIGMPLSMKLRGTELVSQMEFHNTPLAQEIRTICMERADKGLKIPISLTYGFNYDKIKTFDNGKMMWEYLSDSKHNIAKFDENIQKYPNWCFLVEEVSAIKEWSVVIGSNGANPLSQATKVLSDKKNPQMVEDKPEADASLGATMEEQQVTNIVTAVLQKLGIGKNQTALASDEAQQKLSAEQKLVAEQAEQVKVLTAKIEALEVANAAKLAEVKLAAELAGHQAVVDGLIAQGKAIPTQREALVTLRATDVNAYNQLVATFTEPSKTQSVNAETLVTSATTKPKEPENFVQLSASIWNDINQRNQKRAEVRMGGLN